MKLWKKLENDLIIDIKKSDMCPQHDSCWIECEEEDEDVQFFKNSIWVRKTDDEIKQIYYSPILPDAERSDGMWERVARNSSGVINFEEAIQNQINTSNKNIERKNFVLELFSNLTDDQLYELISNK